MEKKNKKMVFNCVLVGKTKRYMKYRMPEEIRDFKKGVVLISGKSIYVDKGDKGNNIERIEMVLNRDDIEIQ